MVQQHPGFVLWASQDQVFPFFFVTKKLNIQWHLLLRQVLEPILSKLLNSLSRFCHEHLVVKHPQYHKSFLDAVPTVPLNVPLCSDSKKLSRVLNVCWGVICMIQLTWYLACEFGIRKPVQVWLGVGEGKTHENCKHLESGWNWLIRHDEAAGFCSSKVQQKLRLQRSLSRWRSTTEASHLLVTNCPGWGPLQWTHVGHLNIFDVSTCIKTVQVTNNDKQQLEDSWRHNWPEEWHILEVLMSGSQQLSPCATEWHHQETAEKSTKDETRINMPTGQDRWPDSVTTPWRLWVDRLCVLR